MKNIFKPKILEIFKNYSKKQLISDLVAGLIVAIIALPLSIALAIASGVSPEKGIYTAIIAGFTISLFGGSRVNISGPTAAFATIVAGIVAEFGINGLIIATIMAGLLLILMGILKLGSLIKYIPCTITTGFTSGIAVTIIIGQIKDFGGLTFPEGTNAVETVEKVEAIIKSLGTINPWAILIGLIGLAILIVWPHINKKIPGSLIAVLVGTILVKALSINVNTIGDLYTINSSLPSFSLPKINTDLIITLIPSAFTIAILAGIESLLSCVVSDGMISDKHNSNTELIAQGIGNVCSGLFGGIPATGAIARTAANVKNGGRSPVSGMTHALVLLLVLIILMPYAAWIPMPIIAAILFIVAYNMSEWREFVHIIKTAPLTDIIVLLLTFALTVVFDLVVAIAVGMIVAIVFFMKNMADNTSVREWTHDGKKEFPENVGIYEIDGPMFFASSEKFENLIKDTDKKAIILRMHNVPMLDASATRNLFKILTLCKKHDIILIISHPTKATLSVMERAGFINALGEENITKNIDDAIKLATLK